jgi:hypothetical protein
LEWVYCPQGKALPANTATNNPKRILVKTRLKLLSHISCSAIALAAVSAPAALQVTNGDFQNNPTQTPDVAGWFDRGTAGNWWESTWAGPTVSPNGTPVLGLSYMFTTVNWAYQSIGVNDANWSAMGVQLDVGSFTDAGGTRNLGVTLSLYQSSSFVGADDLDLVGAAGVTLIDSVSLTSGNLSPGQFVTLTTSLDLATANNTDPLFLHIVNFNTGTGEPWTAIDNISIQAVPEPSVFALGGLGLAALLILRGKQQV